MIRSVVFDVGETLLDDTAEFGRWADWIGVPRHTFSALLGIVTAQGRDNAETFQYFRPGFDMIAERALREEAGVGEQMAESDLYPDVRPALTELRRRGVWVGIAGNQTVRAAELLRDLDLPVEAVATSGEWGVAKPHIEFFDRMATWAGGKRTEILYVGDHRDTDVIAAQRAGLRAALIRRGPWGYLWASDPAVVEASEWIIDSLTELPDLIQHVS